MLNFVPVLVLGANGFIGRNMVEALSVNDYIVHALDRPDHKSSSVYDEKKIKKVSIPLKEINEIKKYIIDNKIKIVFHLVSGLLPSSSYSDFVSEIDNVIKPTFELIDFLSNNDVKLFYFSSGGAVYGNAAIDNLSEEVHCCPTGFYGYSKLIIEDYIKMQANLHKLSYLIVRPSNPYGKYQNPNSNQGFIAVAIGKLINNQTMNIWGDGSVVRDYIYIDDLCDACIKLLKNGVSNEVFNLGTGVGYSLKDVINIINHVTKKQLNIEYQVSRSVDLKKTILDIQKLKANIAFMPRDLHVGLCEYCEWLDF